MPKQIHGGNRECGKYVARKVHQLEHGYGNLWTEGGAAGGIVPFSESR
ncbi:hypothetical protein E2C01_082503 [Portunus trituberculatus]|uniref:Uncharacterized protein n=1 Tax=Portunus trituberculatus TaxID=210409 RepID=A0A5B7IZF8_PORTR|nr:hypothetical protein [Portunus trituberculatus]